MRQLWGNVHVLVPTLTSPAKPDLPMQVKAGSFQIAFDKGALDALMGEDTDAASTAGGKLLSEVQRVLDPFGGQYLCVTLGQPHVLGKYSVYAVLAATHDFRQAAAVVLMQDF